MAADRARRWIAERPHHLGIGAFAAGLALRPAPALATGAVLAAALALARLRPSAVLVAVLLLLGAAAGAARLDAIDRAAGGTEPAAAGDGARAAPISLSNATVAQLDTLDGIGPTLAQRIVQYRASHGGFRSVDELKQVEGIGEKRFASLKAALQP